MKRFLFIIVFLQFFTVLNAQINVEWVYKDPSTSSQLYPVNLALDGENNVYSFIASSSIPIISKLDEDGNFIWEEIPPVVNPNPSDLIYKDDSLFFANGFSLGSSIFVHLLKYSQAGDPIFTKLIDVIDVYGMYGSYSFLDEYNEGFYIGVNKFDSEQESYYVYKTDMYGNVLSANSVANLNDNRITNFYVDDLGYLFTTNNYRYIKKWDSDLNYSLWGYAVVSSNGENGGAGAMVSDEIGNLYARVNFPNDDYNLMKFNPNGEILWTTSYTHPVSGFDHGIYDMIYQDSKIYLVGYSDQPDVPNVLTICYDENGNKLWEDTYYLNADDRVYNPRIFIGNNNNIYSFGYAFPDYSINRKDLFMRVYNQEGTVLTDFEYNSTGDALESCSNVAVSDNKIYLQGTSDDDLMILCLKSDDDIDVEELNSANIDIYPNPAQNKLNIHFDDFSQDSEVNLVIRSLLGETIQSEKIISPSQTINLELASGVYFAILEIDGNSRYSKKLLLQ